jgi:acetoin utilization protein AcuB
MVAKELIDSNIPILKPNDTVEKALDLMIECKINQLPFVNQNHFNGIFSEEFLHHFDYDTTLDSIPPMAETPYIDISAPLIEIIKKFSITTNDILPVLNELNDYLGVIEKKHVHQTFIDLLELDKSGGMLEITFSEKAYSLSEIVRIIENENAKIVNLYLSANHKNETLLTLKLNISQISTVVNALMRYGYEVSSYHTTEPVFNLEKDRYDSLMKYLNI